MRARGRARGRFPLRGAAYQQPQRRRRAFVSVPVPVPVNTIAPVLSTDGDVDNAFVGDTLSLTTGTWTNAPTGYTYLWRRSDVPETIVGATGSSYTLTNDEVGHVITGRVAATNAGGTSSFTTGSTDGGFNFSIPSAASHNVVQAVVLLVGVGQAVEIDAAQAVAHAFRRGTAQAAETEAALAVSARKTKTAGQAAATDAVLAVTARKTKAVGLTSETDTPQPLQGLITRTLGQATETDTALPVTGGTVHRTGAGRMIPIGSRGRERGRFPLRGAAWQPPATVSRSWPGSETGVTVTTSVPVGQAVETDTALNLIFSAKTVTVGQAVETDSAFRVLRARRFRSGFPYPVDTIIAGPFIVAGQAAASDTALAATHRKTKAVGQALDTESAQSVGAVGAKTINVGQAAETDTSQTATRRKTHAAGIATETETAQTTAHAKTIHVGQAAETETAQAVRPARVKHVGLASETVTALAATRVKSRTLGQTLQFESAQAHTRRKRVTLGLDAETDTARPVTITGNDVIVVEIATSTQTAFAVAKLKRTQIGLPQENETAFPCQPIVGHPQTREVGLAAESQTALVLGLLSAIGPPPGVTGLCEPSSSTGRVSPAQLTGVT